MSIIRKQIGSRMSKIVEHNGLIYLSGQVANNIELGIKEQTKDVLEKIDSLLKEAGTNKSNLISAQIVVKDIKNHFKDMNEVWDAWIDPKNPPVRMCIEANMARENILVEILIIAVKN